MDHKARYLIVDNILQTYRELSSSEFQRLCRNFRNFYFCSLQYYVRQSVPDCLFSIYNNLQKSTEERCNFKMLRIERQNPVSTTICSERNTSCTYYDQYIVAKAEHSVHAEIQYFDIPYTLINETQSLELHYWLLLVLYLLLPIMMYPCFIMFVTKIRIILSRKKASKNENVPVK